MKTKRLIILGVLAVLVIAIIFCIVPNYRRHQTIKALQNLYLYRDQMDSAVKSFVRSRKASNSVVPDMASLRELVSGGFLSAKDIRGLEGRDVTVSLTAEDTYPNMIWIRVRMANGRDIVETRDGSIQTMSPNTALEPTATAP